MKTHTKHRHISHYLNSDISLNELLSHTEYLKSIEHIVSACLPAELRQHCKVVNLRSDTLTLSATQSSWATRVRYAIPEIQQHLKLEKNIAPIKTIRVIVSPDSTGNDNKQIRKAKISQQSSDLIIGMSRTINDPELEACLQRLAKHRS